MFGQLGGNRPDAVAPRVAGVPGMEYAREG